MSYLFCFLFTKVGEKEGRTGSAWKRGGLGGEKQGREVAQTMYTHMNKCKNNKIKQNEDEEKKNYHVL
jgi:hypothetical protein